LVCFAVEAAASNFDLRSSFFAVAMGVLLACFMLL